jgi:hypothetical protein
MAIEGDLADIGLPNVMQVLCMERRSRALFLQRLDEKAAVHFDHGEIVHATLGELQGEEAIYRLLTWKDGTFLLISAAAVPAQTIRRDWNQLLLEGMRQIA